MREIESGDCEIFIMSKVESGDCEILFNSSLNKIPRLIVAFTFNLF